LRRGGESTGERRRREHRSRSGAHEAEDGGRGVDASATAGLMRGTERKAAAVGAPPGLPQQAACRTA
jgi:hypothetical protein